MAGAAAGSLHGGDDNTANGVAEGAKLHIFDIQQGHLLKSENLIFFGFLLGSDLNFGRIYCTDNAVLIYVKLK